MTSQTITGHPLAGWHGYDLRHPFTHSLSAVRSRPRWYAEIALVGLLYAAYERSRAAAPSRPGIALTHAHAVASLERSLHLDLEAPLNRVFAAHNWLGALGGYYYGSLHFVVTIGVLVWLYVRRPELYPRARTMLVVTNLAALAVFVAYPVAPPRMAVTGMTDILVTHNIFGAAHAATAGSFVNLYAAMPSLHVGWATWCAYWVVRSHRGVRGRQSAWLYPVATTLVVLGTANHYFLDAAAGVAVVLAAGLLTAPALRVSMRQRFLPQPAPGAPAGSPGRRSPRQA
jgi:hypothetical protein